MSAPIEISGLRKSFGTTVALDGLDLTVAQGEIHGFLGPNGAGKSTTIRVLLGLLRADGGQARLLGGDPWTDVAQLHRRIAYVPGDVALWPNLTGGEVIDLLARLRGGLNAARRDDPVSYTHLDVYKRQAGGPGPQRLAHRVEDVVGAASRFLERLEGRRHCVVVTLGAEPVSYTHLDVYKRQVAVGVGPKLGNVGSGVELHPASETVAATAATMYARASRPMGFPCLTLTRHLTNAHDPNRPPGDSARTVIFAGLPQV